MALNLRKCFDPTAKSTKNMRSFRRPEEGESKSGEDEIRSRKTEGKSVRGSSGKITAHYPIFSFAASHKAATINQLIASLILRQGCVGMGSWKHLSAPNIIRTG